MDPLPPMADMLPANAFQPSCFSTPSIYVGAPNINEQSYLSHEVPEGTDESNVPEYNSNDVHLDSESYFDAASTFADVDKSSDELTYGSPYSRYVCPSGISIDEGFSVFGLDAQLSPPLLDVDHADIVQEHVNLKTSWGRQGDFVTHGISGCYAYGGSFDLDVWTRNQGFPHLDIIDEPDNHLQTQSLQREPYRIGLEPTERQKRPQVVRDWLSAHASWPYPTAAEKSELIVATGYTERQLNNCLSNLRTREKYLFDGHAIEQNHGNVPRRQRRSGTLAYLSHVHSGSAATTHNTLPLSTVSPPAMNINDDNQWSSPSDPGYSTPVSNVAFRTQAYQVTGTEPAYQASQNVNGPCNATMPKRKGRRHRAQGYQVGMDEDLLYTTPIQSLSSRRRELDAPFFCTVVGCTRSFKSAFDWKRHEAGVHGHSDREWICMLTDDLKSRSECVFCSEAMDTIDHLGKHAIAPCSYKRIVERTFFRKDLLKQHVLHAHLVGEHTSVRKNFQVPQDWSRVVESSAVRPDSCWCGFCGRSFESVTTRMDHVEQHFRQGLDMRAWNRT